MPISASIAVIGGGPAALMSAIIAAEHAPGHTIIVCEHNNRCGRKLLITGNGQCNITNAMDSTTMMTHYGSNGHFLEHAYNQLSPELTMRLFERWKLPLTIRDDKKVFPLSMRSSDVLKVLMDRAISLGVQFMTMWHAVSINKDNHSFIITNQRHERLFARSVVIATGGITYPHTGSTGDGYALAQMLGHSIVTPRVALAPVRITNHPMSALSGISFPFVTISKVEQNSAKLLNSGSLLITHEGLSGPVILDASRYLATNDMISVCFVAQQEHPHIDSASYARQLLQHAAQSGSKQLKTTLLDSSPLSRSFITWMLSTLNIDGNRKVAEVGKKQILAISKALVDYRVTISLESTLSKAMVTAGGITLSEIDGSSMESIICPSLFFAGEVIDIDGDTGGYNLQAAWSTGYVAGLHAANNVISHGI